MTTLDRRRQSDAESAQNAEQLFELALARMRSQFGIASLRQGQEEVIRSVLAGRNTLAVMPTGSGKSLCYQLPALELPGVTLVVSPLLALIQDQHDKLESIGAPVGRLDSTIGVRERRKTMEGIASGKLKIVLVTPEWITNPDSRAFLTACAKISLLVIDEAHCASQWGHDFRPAYLQLGHAARELGNPPILGLTATATPRVAEDLLEQLGIPDAYRVRTPFSRPNLIYEAREVYDEDMKRRILMRVLRRLELPGIIYCATIRAVNDLYDELKHAKMPVNKYHGKLTTKERTAEQDAFMASGSKRVMIATTAFGLGVDKSDIRFVVHWNVPGSLESYAQEAGRAGRDGNDSRCVLLFDSQDLSIQEFFLDEMYPSKKEVRAIADALFAWTDTGRAVSIADLATSSHCNQKRARVVLQLLAEEGLVREPEKGLYTLPEGLPTRQLLDASAARYDIKRIADRRRLDTMIAYVRDERCRDLQIRTYFGEDGALLPKCGRCDACAGIPADELAELAQSVQPVRRTKEEAIKERERRLEQARMEKEAQRARAKEASDDRKAAKQRDGRGGSNDQRLRGGSPATGMVRLPDGGVRMFDGPTPTRGYVTSINTGTGGRKRRRRGRGTGQVVVEVLGGEPAVQISTQQPQKQPNVQHAPQQKQPRQGHRMPTGGRHSAVLAALANAPGWSAADLGLGSERRDLAAAPQEIVALDTEFLGFWGVAPPKQPTPPAPKREPVVAAPAAPVETVPPLPLGEALLARAEALPLQERSSRHSTDGQRRGEPRPERSERQHPPRGRKPPARGGQERNPPPPQSLPPLPLEPISDGTVRTAAPHQPRSAEPRHAEQGRADGERTRHRRNRPHDQRPRRGEVAGTGSSRERLYSNDSGSVMPRGMYDPGGT